MYKGVILKKTGTYFESLWFIRTCKYTLTKMASKSIHKSKHYENMPMQYTEIFSPVKIENFQWKIFDIPPILAQNTDCGHTLELPHRGGSNEYPQSTLQSKSKKNRYTPAYPSFAI